MHPHQQRGARANGGFVVAGMGAVGGTHLHQLDPGAGHDVGDAEGTADLDQLAAGQHPFLARPYGMQGQQDRRGVVVDHRHRLGAGEFTHQVGDQVVAIAALAGGQVEFQIHRLTRGLDYRGDGLFRQQRPPQVGVQHRAGEVEHPPHPRLAVQRQALAQATGQHALLHLHGGQGAGPQGLAQIVQQRAIAAEDLLATMALLQRTRSGMAQQAVDGRQANGGHGSLLGRVDPQCSPKS